jgi:hypothetical protein
MEPPAYLKADLHWCPFLAECDSSSDPPDLAANVVPNAAENARIVRLDDDQ